MKYTILLMTAWGVFFPSMTFAHSMWIVLQPAANSKKMVSVWYADRLEPGRSSMLDRLSKLKIVEAAGGTDRRPVEFVKVVTDDLGSLIGTTSADISHVEAICDIGVRPSQNRPQARQGAGESNENRSPELQTADMDSDNYRQIYYAKYIQLNSKAGLNVKSNPEMKLDIDPGWDGENLTIAVYHNGIPEPACTVSITGPDGSRHRLETDETGLVLLEGALPGRYMLRARIDLNEPGELNGKPYLKTTQDASLVLDLQ